MMKKKRNLKTKFGTKSLILGVLFSRRLSVGYAELTTKLRMERKKDRIPVPLH